MVYNMSEQHVSIYTDGSCLGNPGAGGWGVILIYKGIEKALSGGEKDTTNNRMELRAAIEGLRALKRPCLVDIYTDSQYVRRGILEWIENWKARGWKTADKKPVKNEDLWKELDTECQRHIVSWHWVKGHAENELNNRVDALAVSASKKIISE